MRGPVVEHLRGVRVRLLLCVLASALAAGVTAVLDRPRLDVALWAVLAPIAMGGLLALLPRLRSAGAARPHAEVVLPDAAGAPPATPDPLVHARDDTVDHAREALLAAKEREAPMEELLTLARALHDAQLDLARAVLAAGGHVPQAVRDELTLRDRATSPVTPS